jgi:hypothetical protein
VIAMPTKRALLVGIAAYPHVRPLDGCVNDVRLMREVLVESFGFPPEQVTLLADEQATRAGILAAFDALVAATGPDDIVLFHFAGHGSQMTDREGDEPSGFDSTLVPFDAVRPIGDVPDITDDEINLRLEALAQKTPYSTVVIDACHSGTILRDDGGERARSIEADVRPVSELPPSPIPADRRRPLRQAGPSGWMPLADKYVLIAGCRDEEESYEYRPLEGGGRVVHGALTWFLCQQLRRASAAASYRDIFEQTAALVTAAHSMQHPQLEGQIDRAVFGVPDLTPATFIRVLEREDDAVLLGAGAAHGLSAGSTWRLFPQGAKSPTPEGSIGEVAIEQVLSVAALGRIRREASAQLIQPGARAFEETHPGGERLAVVLAQAHDLDEAIAALRGRLEAATRIIMVERDAPAVAIYRLPVRAEVSPSSPVPQAGPVAEPVWAVVGETGELLMPLLALDEVDILAQNLERIAKHRHALAIANSDPKSPLRDRFTVELQRLSSDRKAWIVATPEAGAGPIGLDEGDIVRVVVRSLHEAPAFVALYDFGPSAGIGQIYPARGAQEQLQARGVLTCRPQQLTFPAVYPFVDSTDAAGGLDAIETVKLFVTEQPTDFSGFEQDGVRRGRGSSPPAARLPPRAFGGRAGGGATRGDEDWTTVSMPFVLRRRGTAPIAARAAGQGSGA